MIPALPQVILQCLCRYTANYLLSKLVSLMLMRVRWKNYFPSLPLPLPNPPARILLIKMCCVLTIYNRISSITADFFSHFSTISIVFERQKTPPHRPVELAVILLGLNQFILDRRTGLTECICESQTNSCNHPAMLAPAGQLYWTEISSNQLRVSAFQHWIPVERILLSKYFHIIDMHACSTSVARMHNKWERRLNKHKSLPNGNFTRAYRIYGQLNRQLMLEKTLPGKITICVYCNTW